MMGGLAGGLNFGRNNNAGTQATGVNQTASMRISDIRSNYNYPSWFDTTMGYFRDGKISSQAFESAYANLAKQGLITLKTGGTPATTGGFSKSQIEQIMIDYYGDDIKRLDRIHGEQEARITEGKTHRDSIEGKIDAATLEHATFWDEFSTLHTKHTNQEDRISQKSGIGHTHVNGEEKEDCGWIGEKCWFKPDWDLGWLKWVGLAIGAGLLLWLIRPLFKIGANLTK
jgi:hypothetical protein